MVFSDLHVVKSNGQLSCLTFTIFHNLHHGTFQEMFFLWGFPRGAIRGVKNLTVSAEDVRDMGSIPGMGRSLGGRNGNPLQYSCLENSIDRGAWLVTVHGVAKSQTQLSTHIRTHTHTNVLLCWFWGNHKFSGFPLIFFSGLWTSFSPLLECSRMWVLGLFSLLYLHSVNSLSLLGSLL